MKLNHFLLVYDVESQTLLDVEEFGADAASATARYAALERDARAAGDDDRLEVVLIGADSLETIKKTHSHYFGEGLSPFLLALAD